MKGSLSGFGMFGWLRQKSRPSKKGLLLTNSHSQRWPTYRRQRVRLPDNSAKSTSFGWRSVKLARQAMKREFAMARPTQQTSIYRRDNLQLAPNNRGSEN
jgi:hypothetical protein